MCDKGSISYKLKQSYLEPFYLAIQKGKSELLDAVKNASKLFNLKMKLSEAKGFFRPSKLETNN